MCLQQKIPAVKDPHAGYAGDVETAQQTDRFRSQRRLALTHTFLHLTSFNFSFKTSTFLLCLVILAPWSVVSVAPCNFPPWPAIAGEAVWCSRPGRPVWCCTLYPPQTPVDCRLVSEQHRASSSGNTLQEQPV